MTVNKISNQQIRQILKKCSMMDLKRYWGNDQRYIIKALEEALRKKIDKQLAKEISKKQVLC